MCVMMMSLTSLPNQMTLITSPKKWENSKQLKGLKEFQQLTLWQKFYGIKRYIITVIWAEEPQNNNWGYLSHFSGITGWKKIFVQAGLTKKISDWSLSYNIKINKVDGLHSAETTTKTHIGITKPKQKPTRSCLSSLITQSSKNYHTIVLNKFTLGLKSGETSSAGI